MSSYRAVADPFPGKGPIPAGGSGFYKRAETLTIIQDLLRAGDSISLVGERKAGKTSFLKYLTINLPPDEFIPVFVDTQRIMPRTDQLFLGTLAKSAAKAVARAKGMAKQYAQTYDEASDEGPITRFLRNLLVILDQHFDDEDLRTLCFYLGVEYDNLAAVGKVNKARELIVHLQRREHLPRIVQLGREMRPTVLWEEVPSIFRKSPHLDPLEIKTLGVEANDAYVTFQEDLDNLRSQLPLNSEGKRLQLVWLIDEIETLQDYKDSELFVFLRPFAQSDPDFRMVVAGYDVLYTISSLSKWSPFYNAFRHVRLTGLNPVITQQMIDDALEKMGTTVEQGLYPRIMRWTGQKPFFLKWTLSKVAQALNERQQGYHIDDNLWNAAKNLFLSEKDIAFVFEHLWQNHTSPSQQLVLTLMASAPGLSTHPDILNHLQQRKLLTGSPRAAQDLVDDLTRLEQLGFLYEQIGTYVFSSACLQAWIAKNKPL